MAFCSGVPAPTAPSAEGARPASSGVTSYVESTPSFSSTTRVAPETENSSRPSSLDTTKALSAPSSPSAAAIVSILPGSETPITWRRAPAGFVSGPRKLKIVRTPSSLRTGTMCLNAGWWSGANMNPKPIFSMHSATASGSTSIRPQRASSTSADPHWLVAGRLPCFAPRQPAPAAMKAAVVDTLKVGRPPPVPAVSTRSSPASTFTESLRSVAARPAISPTVSPLVRRAMRNAAAWASEASPSMITRSTREAWSAGRSSPLATRSMASVRTLFGIEEVAEQLVAVWREHRLGVELHPLERQLAVAQAHDHVARARRYLELVGKLRVHDEGVVATDHERRFEALEDRPAVVLGLGR